MSRSESTLNQTGELLQSFLDNILDYFKLFIPLLIIYKLYTHYYKKFKTNDGLLFKILNLFAFGTKADQNNALQVDDNNNNSNSEKNVQIKIIEIERSEEGENGTKRLLSFLGCFIGLQVSFLLWGLMQERIVKYGYKESISEYETKEQILEHKKQFSNFKNSQFLVLSNRFAGLILSSFILIFCNRNSIRISGFGIIKLPFRSNSFRKLVSYQNWAPLFFCSYASLSNVLSSWCQYESLKYVSFTSQLLAKSSKSVFVMLTGKIISNKTYKFHEYVCVFIIGFGLFLFSDINKTHLDETNKIISTTFPGLLCLLGYLISDSFTSTWQDNLIKNFSMSSISLMFITNFYSCIYTLISLVSKDELNETLKFMYDHSDITNHIILLSITSAIGQIFIFVTIQKFGALAFSLMMTTRQILSIVLSSIVFEHSMSLQNVFGIFLIFLALFLQQYLKFYLKPKKMTSLTKL